MTLGQDSLPCIVCRQATERVFDHELQPNEATAFHTNGHYGSTAFDPMDMSELVIVVCDECLTKAGKDGIVAHDQPRIELALSVENAALAVGYYSPEREHVIWNPETQYERQQPTMLEYEDIVTIESLVRLPSSARIAPSAIQYALEAIALEEAEGEHES